jgi:hypothetical protein
MNAIVIRESTVGPTIFGRWISTVLDATTATIAEVRTSDFIQAPSREDLAQEDAEWNALFERKADVLRELVNQARWEAQNGHTRPLRVDDL